MLHTLRKVGIIPLKIHHYYIMNACSNVAVQSLMWAANVPQHRSVIPLQTSFLYNFYAETLGTPGAFRLSLNGVNKVLIACSKAVIDLSCM